MPSSAFHATLLHRESTDPQYFPSSQRFDFTLLDMFYAERLLVPNCAVTKRRDAFSLRLLVPNCGSSVDGSRRLRGRRAE